MKNNFANCTRRFLSMVLAFAMVLSAVIVPQSITVQAAAESVTLELAQSTIFPFDGAVKDFDWGGIAGTPNLENQFVANGGSGGMWIRWKNIDLKGGITGWVMSYAKGNTAENRNFEILVSKPGASFEEAKSLGIQTFNAINTGSWNTNPQAAPQYEVANPIFDGVCDVFIRTRDGSWIFPVISKALKSSTLPLIFGRAEEQMFGSLTTERALTRL